MPANEDGQEQELVFGKRDYERKFFSDETNLSFVRCFLENAKCDPITGEVGKPGPYSLTTPTTVLQLIALAGGLRDFAQSDKILIIRTEKGRPISYKFDYKAVASGKRTGLAANIELKPGDTIIVP